MRVKFILVPAAATIAATASLYISLTAQRSAGRLPPTTPVNGTLIVAHGGGTEWNRRVHELAASVRADGPVGVSFLMGPEASASRFQDVAERLVADGAERITVVPLLVSSRSGHYEQIRYLTGEIDDLGPVMMHHLEMSGIQRRAWAVPVRVTAALDDSPELAAVLADRARAALVSGGAAGGSSSARGRALFLVAHGPNGPEDEAVWMMNLREVADSVSARTGFGTVLAGLMRDDAAPSVRAEAIRRMRELIGLMHEATGQPVVVVPILISTGEITDVKVPADLANLPIIYRAEPLLPHDAITRWVEARAGAPWAEH